MSLPYEPLLTIERSSIPEVVIYGTMSVVDGTGRTLVSVGDQDAKYWSRSCLKPFQLLDHLHILREHYPALEDRHYALMLSSHSAQDFHLKALDEMEAISHLDDSVLQNTPLYPINPDLRMACRAAKKAPTARWGCCSGKHLGFVMALQAEGKDHSHYLEPDQPHFERMKKMMAHFLQLNWQDIPQTTDGCRLPNYAFKAFEIARLYQQLASPYNSLGLPVPTDEELKGQVAEFDKLKIFMSKYPQYVGGDERFDTELMQGKYTDINEAVLVAKEGADGIITIGVAPCKRYPTGLGIFVKSSSGDDPRYFSLIALELLDKLKLLLPSKRRENRLKHLNFVYHFEAPELASL